jgi:DNA-binding transcriptional MerR regulator
MNNENKHISIGEVAKTLGVSVVTLRRWEKIGKLNSIFRTFGIFEIYIHSVIT